MTFLRLSTPYAKLVRALYLSRLGGGLWLLLSLLLLQCQRLPGTTGGSPGRSGAVRLQPGSTRAILLRATLLLPTGVLAPGEVLIDTAGRIACVGPNCAGHPAARGASCLEAPHGVVSPGLLNVHDHLGYDHLAPWRIARPYTNRQQWRLGLNGYERQVTRPDTTPARLLWTELRQVLVGTTAVAGSNRAPGLLRNLDRVDARLGLRGPAIAYLVFPLFNKGTPSPATGCGYPVFARPLGADVAYILHVNEGTDAVSANEFRCLAGLLPGSQRRLPDYSILIQALGLSAADLAWACAHHLSAVWSPRSNLTLYGQTSDAVRYDSLGLNLLLGTDWTPSGSATLPAEMRFAAAYSRAHLGGYFSSQQLWQMVTRNPARGLRLDDQLGELVVGRWADVVLYAGGSYHTPYEAVSEARPATTQLVLRAGQPLYGDAALLRRLPASRHRSPRLRLGPGQPPKRVYWPAAMPVDLRQLRRANRTSLPLVVPE